LQALFYVQNSPQYPVGVSLLAIAVDQSHRCCMDGRNREQAHSYMGLCVGRGLRSLLKLLPILVRRQLGVLAEQPRKEARVVITDLITDGLDAFAAAGQ